MSPMIKEGPFRMNQIKVLVVDDDQTLRAALFRILSRKGYQVITCAAAREAEHVIAEQPHIDLALLDIVFPTATVSKFLN